LQPSRSFPLSPSPPKPGLALQGALPSLDQPATLEGIFRRYSSYVARIGMKLLGRPDEVEDLVQDVFVVAARGLEELRDPTAVKPWLITVTVRLARRKLRRRRLSLLFLLEKPHAYDNIVWQTSDPERRAMLARLYAVLDGIPTNQRIAWTLRYVEGERLDDIARISGCSIAAVKRRIAAAHDIIREGV
jgi:RNA polymerase sigma-70 factor (ECF subfamily)